MTYSGDFTDAEFAKLPKWAQRRVENLIRRTRDAEKRAEEARLATEPHLSDTLLFPYADIPIGLGKGETVRFITATGEVDRHNKHVDIRVDEWGRVVIHGTRTIHIIPQASNAARIEVGDD